MHIYSPWAPRAAWAPLCPMGPRGPMGPHGPPWGPHGAPMGPLGPFRPRQSPARTLFVFFTDFGPGRKSGSHVFCFFRGFWAPRPKKAGKKSPPQAKPLPRLHPGRNSESGGGLGSGFGVLRVGFEAKMASEVRPGVPGSQCSPERAPAPPGPGPPRAPGTRHGGNPGPQCPGVPGSWLYVDAHAHTFWVAAAA